MKRIIQFLTCLLFANSVYAFDSSQAFNTITFSYVDNTYVSQQFVLSTTQQNTATSFKLTVDAKDGGGRPTHNLDGTCAAYCTQYDTARIEIIAYNSSGGVISTKTAVENLKNWGSASNPGWSVAPGDNQFDWSTMTTEITAADVGGSFSSVARIEVRLVNQNEGSYWAGNYGVQFRTPTLQVNGAGNNVLYNSEFGVDSSGVKVQGWTPSYSAYSTCGTTSGNAICTTLEPTVTANMWGGGQDPNGGTTASQPGGYSSVLTADNADTAASTGDPTAGGGSSQPVDPNTTTVSVSGGMTVNQSNRKGAAQILRNSYSNNHIYIEQVGNNNNISITQSSSNNTVVGINQEPAKILGNNNNIDIRQGAQGANGRNLVQLETSGDLNTIKIWQDRNNDGTEDSSANANHIAILSVTGGSNTVSSIQRNNLSYPEGHFVDINVNGSSNNVSSLQISDVGKTGFINIQGDSNVVNFNQSGNAAQYADIKLTGNGHNVSLTQAGDAAHKATLDLTNNGAASTVSVVQQGTTAQSYSLIQTCVASPCGATITQGQ